MVTPDDRPSAPAPSPVPVALDAPAMALATEPVAPAAVVAGDPRVGAADLPAPPGLAVGVWEHSAGTSSDVEVDEVFVVLSGAATVEVEGGPTLQLRAGSVGVLPAGARTVWTVHETLRKVWVTRG